MSLTSFVSLVSFVVKFGRGPVLTRKRGPVVRNNGAQKPKGRSVLRTAPSRDSEVIRVYG